jgi:hypothetical protein
MQRKSLLGWRKACLLAVVSLVCHSAAYADQLFFSYSDPTGDQTGTIDVVEMNCAFDTATGGYEIILNAAPARPFVGIFRVNINLFNPDVVPAQSLLQDVLNDYNLTMPTTQLRLTGVSANLLVWGAGQRVASNTLAGLGNPPMATLFRSAVNNFPLTFLTNEDAIAYGTAGATTIGLFTPPTATELLKDSVQSLQHAGAINQGQLNALMNKLDHTLSNLNRGRTQQACQQLQAFINQTVSLQTEGVLTNIQAQPLLNQANGLRTQIGC